MTRNENYERNILKWFVESTSEERLLGLQWYPKALQYARNISKVTGVPVNKVAGVISALSPQNKWSQNLKDARNICVCHANLTPYDTFKYSTFSKNVDKAILILTTDLDPCEILNKSGRSFKTLNFYKNIMGIDDKTSVTIDRHAINIATGIIEAGAKRIKISEYREVSNAYSLVAEAVNMLPKTLQAITWLTYKRIINR
tara:strand:+ start:384 stop:983 length:600 start_codon:yes stop_codon:yes gene_type:complete